MKSIQTFKSKSIRVVLTDIDGTLTLKGRLPASSYDRLWRLQASGLTVIPVTGRPAGWCELIARFWPVHGVVGENGAFYFRLADGKMHRHFARSKDERKKDRIKLRSIAKRIREAVPPSRVASDQFSRLFDLAVDIAEDVAPLPATEVTKIVALFREHGAIAKVSNIHVNGWFGDYNKLSTTKRYLMSEFAMSEERMKKECVFVGDSLNDEPMFEFFPNSIAVANIRPYLPQLKHRPAYVTEAFEAEGFAEAADRLLPLKS